MCGGLFPSKRCRYSVHDLAKTTSSSRIHMSAECTFRVHDPSNPHPTSKGARTFAARPGGISLRVARHAARMPKISSGFVLRIPYSSVRVKARPPGGVEAVSALHSLILHSKVPLFSIEPLRTRDLVPLSLSLSPFSHFPSLIQPTAADKTGLRCVRASSSDCAVPVSHHVSRWLNRSSPQP